MLPPLSLWVCSQCLCTCVLCSNLVLLRETHIHTHTRPHACTGMHCEGVALWFKHTLQHPPVTQMEGGKTPCRYHTVANSSASFHLFFCFSPLSCVSFHVQPHPLFLFLLSVFVPSSLSCNSDGWPKFECVSNIV